MAEVFQPKMVTHIISVQGMASGIFMVKTIYPETDALNAIGHVIRALWNKSRDSVDDTLEQGHAILNTNDTLQAIWAAPSQNLWVCSARGNVWTTANVDWPPQRVPGVVLHEQAPGFEWRVTTLPNRKGANHPPILNAIWGTGDSDVHVGDFKGAMYHWDGTSWTQLPIDVQAGINHIHGSAPDNVFAVGDRGLILRFDGASWLRLPYPGDAGDSDPLTGVRVINPDEVLICGRAGRVLHGGMQGFHVLAEGEARFYAIARFRDRTLLAAGQSGVWELTKNRLSVLKDNIMAVGLFESGKVLFAVEATQDPGPMLLQYNPTAEEQWMEWSF